MLITTLFIFVEACMLSVLTSLLVRMGAACMPYGSNIIIIITTTIYLHLVRHTYHCIY